MKLFYTNLILVTKIAVKCSKCRDVKFKNKRDLNPFCLDPKVFNISKLS